MWLEKILCMISVFKFIKFWGGWNMVCFVGNAMWTWEECTFYSFLIEYIINIYYIKLINSEFLVKCILSYILPAGPFSYWSRVVKVSNHNSRFLVASHLFLSLVFQDSIIRYMHVKIVMSLKKKDCYVFLENWALHYYVYPSLFLIISLVLKYAVLGINTASFKLL